LEDLGNRAGNAAGTELEQGHLWYKLRPNATPIGMVRPAINSSKTLFDRDHQPTDQSRHFLQGGGIVPLDDLREPNQAFLIVHGGYFGRRDGKYRPQEIILDVRHRNTSIASLPDERRWKDDCFALV
jgi:hypothetical protein